MTNDEMQRFDGDDSRLARLEESFTALVELARRRGVHPNTIGHRFDNDEARVARLEESFTLLIELARRTQERPDTTATLRHTMDELAQKMITLAEAQRRRESC